MKICVYGLWHLGCVTAACLAEAGHTVIGLDQDERVIENLKREIPPILEPGLEELVRKGLASGVLGFSADMAIALEETRVIWVTFDTPVDEKDQADSDYVYKKITLLFPYLKDQTLVLISSQLPVGSTKHLAAAYQKTFPHGKVHFAYSPENLRLGKAISVFTNPDRVVAGIENMDARRLIEEVFQPFSPRFEWMSIESAEMTKHAVNAFLATSVTFINEIASLCEQVGADAKEVERGLKSDSRIGERAYLSPGSAYSGGTLARDIRFLGDLGSRLHQPTPLISGVEQSNDAHRMWAVRRLKQELGDFLQKKIAVWGLTYKAGTDTLRRSGAVDICRELAAQGVILQAYDPSIKSLPETYAQFISLFPSAEEALRDADALIVYTGWPEFKTIDKEDFLSNLKNPLVLDANRYLAEVLEGDEDIRYLSVGKGE